MKLIDYFTKWVEAKLLAQIIEAKARDFIWKSIICQFRLPRAIITSNDLYFDNQKFKDFYWKLHIDYRLTLMGHPQSNREIEVTIRTIL